MTLPAPRKTVPDSASQHAPYEPVPQINGPLKALGKLSIEPFQKHDSRTCSSMMHAWHPQAAPRHPGQVLKYRLISDQYGRLGGLSCRAASGHEQVRPEFIG